MRVFLFTLQLVSVACLRLSAGGIFSQGAYPDSDDSLPIHENCKRLISVFGTSNDFRECHDDRTGDYVINNYCLSLQPGTLEVPQFSTDIIINIGVVTVDDRVNHDGHKLWSAYAAKHGYTYIKKSPDGGDAMEKDWSSTAKLMEILREPAYQHITHFMYTELDQWPVRPMAKLEPLFDKAGLVDTFLFGKKNIMAVVGEYPCENIRNGGHFNLGNFLFARDERIGPLFDEWYKSHAFNFARIMRKWNIKSAARNNASFVGNITFARYMSALDAPHWPARQGAFSVDVYPKYRNVVFKFANGNPFGSPFGTLIGHVTGGLLAHTYNPYKARGLFHLMSTCVARRLENNDTQPCSYYPAWIDGTCLICRGFIEVKGDRFPYTGCCGEVDRALPLETFKIQAEKGELEPGIEIDLNNIHVLDGRTR